MAKDTSAHMRALDLPPVATARPRTGGTPKNSTKRSFASLRTIGALILREMSTRYGKSVGGYLWAVVEPLAAIVLMAFGFSLLIRTPSLGSDFFLFYATGYLPFYIYQQISLYVSRAIVFSKPLLFYPVVTWMDAVLARLILNTLTGVMVSYLTMLIILLALDTRTVLDAVPMIQAVALTVFFAFGIGVVNCVLIGLFPVWEIVWSIITRPLFIVSGVFFLYEDMPSNLQAILWFNPLLHITGLFREGIYPMYAPQYVSIAYVTVVSLVLTAAGLLLLSRYHRDILENS